MRILLIGSHIGSAMFILSSIEDEVVTLTNLFPDYNSSYLRHFIEICSQSNMPDAINVYNKTPWSEMKYLSANPPAEWESIKKVNEMCGWVPDIIIYIYSKEYQMDEPTSIIIREKNIQTYSINADDRSFEKTLKILVKGFYPRQFPISRRTAGIPIPRRNRRQFDEQMSHSA